MKKTKILFGCKHNVFRSKIAEAYLKKINNDKNLVVTSAGLIKGKKLNKNVLTVAKEFGMNLKGSPKGLDSYLVSQQNFIVIVADDVPNIFDRKEYIDFRKTKVLVWKIPDNPNGKNPIKIRQITKAIMKKVEELNRSLQKKK